MNYLLHVCLLLLLFYLPLTGSGQAQTTRWRAFSVGFGVGFAALRDEAVTPLTRKGTAFPVGFRFESRGNRSWHNVNLFYADFPSVESAYQNGTDVQTGQLAYTYRRAVADWHGWRMWAGATLAAEGYSLVYLDGFGNGANATALLTLNPSIAATRPIGSGSLDLNASAGLAGYTIRPNYSLVYEGVNTLADFLKAGQMEIFPRLGMFSAAASYHTYLSPKFRLRFDYQWRLLTNRQPRVSGLLTNQLMMSLAYRF